MKSRAQFKPGDFSLGQIHEWLGAFGRKGGTPDLLQASLEDQTLMERLVYSWQSGEYKPTTSQELAKAIMPKGHFFGPEDWLTHFGGRVKFNKTQLTKVAEIPWSEEELKNPGINQPHFLFLGIEKLDGKSLNLPKWHEVYPSREEHPKFHTDSWYLEEPYAKDTCQLCWYLMPVGAVKGSDNHTRRYQQAMLLDSYEVPSIVERVMANILFYLLNSKYLDQELYARTRDKGGRQVSVGGWFNHGVRIDNWNVVNYSYIGVAASRKILES